MTTSLQPLHGQAHGRLNRCIGVQDMLMQFLIHIIVMSMMFMSLHRDIQTDKLGNSFPATK